MEFDRLVRPLAGAAPCGEDLMFSAAFDEIQEARRHDDPTLSQGDWVTELKEADWPRVVARCSELLATRSKDLRLAVWLTEALVHTRGLDGLGDGYRLLAGLCETCWAELHPQPEGEDMSLRCGSLDWLLTRSVQWVRAVPLTDGARGSYAYADLEAARRLARSPRHHADGAAAPAATPVVTQEGFDAALRDTPAAVLAARRLAAETAARALAALQAVVDARLGAQGPSFAAAREALDAVAGTLARFDDGRDGGARVPAGPAAGETGPGAQLPVSAAPAAGGGLASRAQALAQLREVADFFRRTEPHSPVAYLAAKAARWGEMSLHEWLRAVVKDDGALSQVEELLGVERGTTGG